MFLPSFDVEETFDSLWGTDCEILLQWCSLPDDLYRADGSLLELGRRFRLGIKKMFEFIDITLFSNVSSKKSNILQ